VYDLLATVGHVQDFKSGGNLVAHIHVGTTYHSRKEVRTLLVNDLFQSLSSLRYRLHYAGEILRRSFISTVRPTVHTNPSRKRSFSKTLFKPQEFENAGFSFSCGPIAHLGDKLKVRLQVHRSVPN